MAPTRFEAEDVDPSPLGQPLRFEFSGLTAKNRFMKAAMTERLSTWDPNDFKKRGIPTPELINVYRRWGEGGFGVVMTGNVMIEYDHLEAPGNMIIPFDEAPEGTRFKAYKHLATAAKKEGSLFVAQLSHPGRQVSEDVQKNPISASDVQLAGDVMGLHFAKPRPMEQKDIDRVIKGFAHAAEYSHKAGFDGVQLHGAHGYLLAQFLAPSTNKRTDIYGGSLLNRGRIIMEIADAVKARVNDPSFSLGIKINSVEFQEGGFSPEDSALLCEELEKHGFDYKREAFFLDFADSIVPRLNKTKAYVVGGLRSAGAIVKALDSVHGVSLARPIAHEFDLPKKILAGEVQSAIKYKLDEQDFGATNVAAGTQIRLVGRDKEPLDMSQDQHKDAFMASMQKWSEEMANNKDGSKFGYVDIDGIQLQSFGTAYAT
ncbi:oxidoreductase [Diaporthe helianthi]|uniref:Oxidoreductase n=1 Tax=Diaporthe helianthi TaxID=158607 RepID=A0A2P5HND4_DIAHE|nr:oxidoreductase [Diaporthe helianthi]